MKGPRFYFSLRSPYSWLAYRDLLAEHPRLAGEVEWIPFWEPDELSRKLLADAGGEFLYTPMSKAKHLYILQDVRRLARARGLEPAWPIDREPHWEVPHLAYLAARRLGHGPAFIAHAYRARWEEGRDICDPATVAAIASLLPAAPDLLAAAHTDPDIRAEGTGVLMRIFRDGVFGVPYFVRGHDRFWGLDRLPDFAAARQDAAPPDMPGTGGLSGRVDDGHAGGCG